MRICLLALALLAASPLLAQEATLNTPVTRTSEAKLVVVSFTATQGQVAVNVSVRDSGGTDIRAVTHLIPDAAHAGATVAGFLAALETTRSGETGGTLRKTNFRILGYLSDQGYLTGVTLVP